ncbi:excinuclease ABC subunit UvrA [Quisquiliibacterium transsilvanicum]|uniref:UvrABC system protein A n=1 Tax=Quisquiliibacterium transsilvanicum TaxID=1549638 RepID=A0A7W8HHW7_9BURK|nr:excinuclease ABC subunit UvrA [Quisquiliibacterium transsilvanicum]MBB5272341.1 excinuclease ABC subunit A [Quisquiliibacterium transsilvanicum]
MPAQDPDARRPAIRIRGARQNNLQKLDLDLPTNELIVVTGVSGSGKSSLVFDTLYAEGQRRYVETFSAYARQFLDRMDKPQVDRIEGVPPAIAIDQTNPVRTSRSTVGTMTELNDHLKLLFARAATLHCRCCARPVRRDTVAGVRAAIAARAAAAGDPRLVLSFPVPVPVNFGEQEVRAHLEAQGYTKVQAVESPGPVADSAPAAKTGRSSAKAKAGKEAGTKLLHVVQDRFRVTSVEDGRISEAVEHALARGHGRMSVHVLDDEGEEAARWRFSTELHCADCDIAYSDPLPSLFSFNSPLGACETCRGFGRVIGIDLGLVIPDQARTLADGAVKPWQTESFKDCQREMTKYAPAVGVPLGVPWRALSDAQRRWVIEGGDDWTGKWQTQWYGIRRFFDWLESKAYKMHIRVLLSKYRSYTPCTACQGARLKPDALLWRVGSRAEADAALAASAQGEGHYKRYMPAGVTWSEPQLQDTAGLSIHDLMLLPIDRVAAFFESLRLPPPLDEATDLLLTEARARLRYLQQVGLGYLTLDRQSRTLSGGEVQRINLTTALGTSLVNTLFVLDEPSIGLHPRDMNRVIEVMRRLRDAGNSLVVVEHDPQVMFAADRMIDIGPGPGERGGRIVYNGDPRGLRDSDTLTGEYLSGRRKVDTEHPQPVGPSTKKLVLEGAREHNLRDVDVEIPLERLVCLTGVSGSGKSTLMQNVLLPALLKARGKASESPGAHDRLLGDDWIGEVVFVDQTPIGKTARSNPASYVGAFDAIRKRFAAAELSKERGYTAGTFSFNAGDGRCPTCGGNGFEHVEMQFLSDVYLRCADCDGKRFRAEVLEVTIDGRDGRARSVADVLELTVHEALSVFAGERELRAKLQPLADVGLDYLRLGQPVPTLSGGEAQRLKLAGFLGEAASQGLTATGSPGHAFAKAGRRGTLFMFDEPTTGLHFDDVARLLRAFRKLLAAGHSLLVIEHNLDVIRASDWLIDLGPEGGDGGGRVVATGTPKQLAEAADTHTGRALADYALALAGGGEAAAPRADVTTLHAAEPPGRPLQNVLRERARDAIFVHHAREHNLKNVDVEIPRDRFTVITGVSGSGKSTLAFDVVFGEGQRRYLESLNAYARQFVQPSSRPDVDGVFGIPPTVAIEQRTSRGGRKSTVATLTEIYHFLRLLYVKLGRQHCPDCGVPIEPQSFDAIAARILRDYRGRHIGLLAPLVVARKGVYTDLAKWAAAKGHGHLRVDGSFLPTAGFPRLDRYAEHDIELPVTDLIVDPANEAGLREALRRALELGKGIVMIASPLDGLRVASDAADHSAYVAAAEALETRLFSTKRACSSCGTSFPEPDPRMFSFNSKMGWCAHCLGTGVKLPYLPEIDPRRRPDEDSSAEAIGAMAEKLADQQAAQAASAAADDGEAAAPAQEPCPGCAGQRLNRTALAVKLLDLSIAELTAMPVGDCGRWLAQVGFAGREQEIARDVLAEIRGRLSFLSDVGLGYLALDRAAPTLSGGEAQRIRLAAQLGSNLQGVCYVLDEPTIGLHPHDNNILLDTLEALRDKGNTLLVVEHDEDTIRRADHVIDMGPGAGRLGGWVIATGRHDELAAHPESVTGRFLANPLAHPLSPPRPMAPDRTGPDDAGLPAGTGTEPATSPGQDANWLRLRAAHLHNLRHVDARIPLKRLTVVTGVSGSGKSTLARDVLLANVSALVQARNRRGPQPRLSGVEGIEGWQGITRVLEVDQTPIGKTPRSCPATYVGFWDPIRRLFADTGEARIRGWGPGRFSFNTAGGRCEACDGQGQQTIEMSFLPDVKVLCEVCGGRRFNRETLDVQLRGRSIGDVLAMDIDEALEFFAAHPSIEHPLKLLQDVGLGYLTLGQPSPTLSGGEAQRIKLVTELAKVRMRGEGGEDDPRLARARAKAVAAGRTLPPGPHTLYVLDEPTVGLHMADVEKLIRVFHRLVDAGNTLVVVEHSLDIWAEADWIVDLGPEGGAGGGRIVAAAPPLALAARGDTHTARALAGFLGRVPAQPLHAQPLHAQPFPAAPGARTLTSR